MGRWRPRPQRVADSAERLLAHVHDPLLDPVKRLAALQARMTRDGVKLG